MFQKIFLFSLFLILLVFIVYFSRDGENQNLVEPGSTALSSTPSLQEESSLGEYFKSNKKVDPTQTLVQKDEVKTCVIDGQTVEEGQSVSGTTCAP